MAIQERCLLRRLVSSDIGWNDKLPCDFQTDAWEEWKESLKELGNIHIPRKYIPNLQNDVKKELYIFCDASKEAIAVVVYVRTIDKDCQNHVSFKLRKAIIAPSEGYAILRLEFCDAVLAVQILETVVENLKLEFHEVKLYTGSQIVFGYIHNTSRRNQCLCWEYNCTYPKNNRTETVVTHMN